MSAPKFTTPKIVITEGANALLTTHNIAAQSLIDRHFSGDFGDVEADDAQTNLQAISSRNLVLSSYAAGGDRLWVITDPGHLTTTILTPDEY